MKRAMIGIIIMVIIVSVGFAKGMAETEKDFAVVGGAVFQTEDGQGDLPYLGVNAGLTTRVYESEFDVWASAYWERMWQFHLANPQASPGTYIRDNLGLGADIMFDTGENIEIGTGGGFVYRMTTMTNEYTSNYGVYAQGLARIFPFGDRYEAVIGIQPSVGLKYFFGSSFEASVGLKVVFRPF